MICIARRLPLGLSSLTQMADTMNATLANMTGAISPRMRLELLAARFLAGREEGVAAVASSSGMPDFAGDSEEAAAAESLRGSMTGSASPCGETYRRRSATGFRIGN